MENYRKTTTRQEETTELLATPMIKVNANGKVKNYVNAAEKLFMNEKQVFVSGVGSAINKAVSVAEVIARNHKGSTLATVIFEVKEVDVWESITGELDTLEVTRRLPGIRLSILI